MQQILGSPFCSKLCIPFWPILLITASLLPLRAQDATTDSTDTTRTSTAEAPTPSAPRADNLDPAKVAFFEQNVLPILNQHCYTCHSHEQEISGNLALDFANGWKVGGDRGPAIQPGDPKGSLLLQAVRGEIADLKMPPEELEKLPKIGALLKQQQDQKRAREAWLNKGKE